MASQGAAWVKEGAWELVAFPYGDGSISPLSHGTAAIHLFAPKCGSHAPLRARFLPGESFRSAGSAAPPPLFQIVCQVIAVFPRLRSRPTLGNRHNR